MQQLTVKVASRTQEADDIVVFELVPVDGAALPPFSAGAHIDVYINGGLVRQYSLCNSDAEQHRYVIGVLRDGASRGGSAALHEQLRLNDVLQIGTPRNHFPLVSAQRVLLLAGGIGITPLLCMAERLAHNGVDFDLHYCSRSPDKAAFRQRLASAPYARRVHFHFDDGAQEQRLDLPPLLSGPAAGTHLYTCGPGGFIDHVVGTAQAQGWHGDNIHREYFVGRAVDNTINDSFDIKVASSGAIFTVAPGISITGALAQHGIMLPVSCEQGICGSCITRVLQGVPDHRDMCLSDAERALNDQFTPCCSRARSKLLVLDL